MTPDDRATRRAGEHSAFFGPRAEGWDERFADDGAAFDAAVVALGLCPGQVALDAGCGTGRAIAPLRSAVGPAGEVLAVDVTAEMLAVAARKCGARCAGLLLADAVQLPFATASFDAVLAAGLLPHLADPVAGLSELARVTRPGGRLGVFHPVGRAALAIRHQRTLSDDDLLHPPNLTVAFDASGWELEHIDDADNRYLAVGTRAGPRPMARSGAATVRP